MHKLVERSVALWKAKHGPIRRKIGRHLSDPMVGLATPIAERHSDFIDYTTRRCDYT
ncbi:MAG: hypothetical protein AAGJ29_07145 [Pseudomonadota bacterium]